jgi:hypothetical protein
LFRRRPRPAGGGSLLAEEAAASITTASVQTKTRKNRENTGPADAELVSFCAAKVPGVVEVGSCLCFRGQNRNRG